MRPPQVLTVSFSIHDSRSSIFTTQKSIFQDFSVINQKIPNELPIK